MQNISYRLHPQAATRFLQYITANEARDGSGHATYFLHTGWGSTDSIKNKCRCQVRLCTHWYVKLFCQAATCILNKAGSYCFCS